MKCGGQPWAAPHGQWDTAGHPAEWAIERFSEYGIVMGYDGYFRPENRWNQERTKGPGLCPAKERETDI